MDVSHILIDGTLVSYTCPDDLWTKDAIEALYVRIRNNKLAEEARKMQQEGKSTQIIQEMLIQPIPPLYWYPLNMFGSPNYSFSKEGELLTHSTGEVTKGSYIQNKGFQLTLYDPATGKGKKKLAHRIWAMLFLGPPPTLNAIVMRLGNSISDVAWGQKNETRHGMAYKKKGLSRPITQYRRPDGYKRYFPYVTFFQMQHANDALVKEVADCGLVELAQNIATGGKGNIRKACIAAKENGDVLPPNAYGCLWEYETGSSYGEVWTDVSMDGIETIQVSSRGRIRTQDGLYGSGSIHSHGYKVCHLRQTVSNGKKVTKRIDMLVMMAFLGISQVNECLSKGMILYHMNTNLLDSDFCNLRWFENAAQVSQFLQEPPTTQQQVTAQKRLEARQTLLDFIKKQESTKKITPFIAGGLTTYHLTGKYQPNDVYTVHPEDYRYNAKFDKRTTLHPSIANIPREFRQKIYDVGGNKIKKGARPVARRRETRPRNLQLELKVAQKEYERDIDQRLEEERREQEEEMEAEFESQRNEQDAEAFCRLLQESNLSYPEFVKRYGKFA